MANYYIVAAKPRGGSNHVKSQFKIYEDKALDGCELIGWKSIVWVAVELKKDSVIRTAKFIGTTLHVGAAVELELRIAKNDTNFKISDMPND